MGACNAWLLAEVSSGFGLWILAFAAFLDALIIPIPTELIVLAVASAYRSTGSPVPAAVFLVCALSFMLGDLATYELGGAVQLRSIIFFRNAAGKAVISWAHRAFERQGGLYTVASRFVPAGRTVLNVTAGADHYPLSKYLPLSALAGFLWSVYMWTLGYVAAAWIVNNPLGVMGLGFVVGALVGFLCDLAMKVFSRGH